MSDVIVDFSKMGKMKLPIPEFVPKRMVVPPVSVLTYMEQVYLDVPTRHAVIISEGFGRKTITFTLGSNIKYVWVNSLITAVSIEVYESILSLKAPSVVILFTRGAIVEDHCIAILPDKGVLMLTTITSDYDVYLER